MGSRDGQELGGGTLTESDLVQALKKFVKGLLPFAIFIKLADRFNSGYPDVTVTWRGITSWWELKHYDNEAFKSPELQETRCKQLGEQGICHYVIYEERKGVRRTLIVAPKDMDHWEQTNNWAPGFDHTFVVKFIRQCHLYPEQFKPAA